MLLFFRNFRNCTNYVKCLLFTSFITSFCCLLLVVRVRISDVNRLRVCCNNSLMKPFSNGRQCSISTQCVGLGITTFVQEHHKSTVRLLLRLKNTRQQNHQQFDICAQKHDLTYIWTAMRDSNYAFVRNHDLRAYMDSKPWFRRKFRIGDQKIVYYTTPADW